MANERIYCPGGKPSQTGTAVTARYPEAEIETCGDDIRQIPQSLNSRPGKYAIPIWNSHVGEIGFAKFVWDGIEARSLKLSDIWAKRIEFWWVRRQNVAIQFNKIGSVRVASIQCSGFLARNKFDLDGRTLTTVAFSDYKKGEAWDGVLLADGQGEGEVGFEVIDRSVANPNNFTSFVTAMPYAFNDDAVNENGVRLTGVSIQKFGATLGDAEQSLFTRMLEKADRLDDVPRLAFVFERDSKVGLLFEGAALYGADLLDAEEIESADIKVHEEAGATKGLYSDQLNQLFQAEFPILLTHDFLFHDGVDTCLFACPTLGIYTHGFSREAVEPVFRFYVGRIFERWGNELLCTAEQDKFFIKYFSEWEDKGSAFINFERVSAT